MELIAHLQAIIDNENCPTVARNHAKSAMLIVNPPPDRSHLICQICKEREVISYFEESWCQECKDNFYERVQ